VTVNRDGDSARYWVRVRGLDDEIAGVQIVFADASVLALDGSRGSVELAEGQREALPGSMLQILVAGEGEETVVALEGDLDSRRRRGHERRAARRAGRGALRLSSRREDSMPFDVENLADLEGVAIEVVDADSATVLSGIVDIAVPREGDGDGEDPGEAELRRDDDDDSFVFSVPESHDASFVRGDANDDGVVDVADAVAALLHLFRADAEPYCPDALDANDDGQVNLSDPVRVLNHLFQLGAPLAAPYPSRGFDATADELLCRSYES